MNTKHLFVGKKFLTAVFVFFFSIFGIQSSYADYYPSGPQQNVSEQTLRDNGWTLFLEQTYATRIGSSGSQLIPSGPYVILTGKAVGSSTLPVLAAAPTSQVFTETALDTPQLINGTYWYYTQNRSIGFSPTNIITQNPADNTDTSSPLRLSWHLLTSDGGWRLGATTWLNNSTNYLQQVWTWNGPTASAPAPVFVRQSSNLTFAQSLYASDTLSDPDGELRKTVDQIMAKYGSLIK
jgi:hypothetical protein